MEGLVVAIIGPGVMGEALTAGLLRTGMVTPGCLLVSGPQSERVEALRDRFGIQPYTDNAAAASQADIVLLAVKPQRLKAVLTGLHGRIRPDALIISIVAGATIQKISDGLGHRAIVRSMPNTPAQIGEGITVWTASSDVLPEQLKLAEQVLSAIGQHVYLADESYLDMATALSGSGPAYVFLFVEAMIDAGVHLGFPRRIAEQLVIETLRGSVDYYVSKKDHPAQLRNEVTSPAGTSAAALYYLEKAGFRTAISRAVWAAYERSQELGKGKESQAPENHN
jgi:pyrroline-5-carboxylate reductase